MSCSYCHFVASATAYKYMSVSIGQMISLQYALDDDATNVNDAKEDCLKNATCHMFYDSEGTGNHFF